MLNILIRTYFKLNKCNADAFGEVNQSQSSGHNDMKLNFVEGMLKTGSDFKPFPRDGGFTLLELMIAVIIVGVLSAIALPNMLGNVGKAKATEAKTTIGTINSTQVIHQAEKGKFAPDLDALGINVPAKGKNYFFEVKSDSHKTTVTATALDRALHGFSGGTVMYVDKNGLSATTNIICENKLPGTAKPEIPLLEPDADTPEIAARCNEELQNQL